MLRYFALVTVLCALAACGADGPPERPGAQPAPGIAVSGTVSVGIGGSL